LAAVSIYARERNGKGNKIQLSVSNWLVHIRLSVIEKFESSILIRGFLLNFSTLQENCLLIITTVQQLIITTVPKIDALVEKS